VVEVDAAGTGKLLKPRPMFRGSVHRYPQGTRATIPFSFHNNVYLKKWPLPQSSLGKILQQAA
jgi:hypothetical protein